MEIWHRVSFNGDVDPDFKAALGKVGIEYGLSPLPGHSIGFVYFDITESHPQWTYIEELIRAKGASDIFNTKFTVAEILNFEWIRLVPVFEQGYPQPEAEMVWKQNTYENQCAQCGVGYQQKAPFRLAKEPRLGKHDFLCLYWTYTVFCIPKVLEVLQTHQIRGYEVWEAIIHRANQPSKIVSQLVFPSVASPGLAEVDKLQPETCAECGITKYASHLRGYMHLRREALQSDVDILQTYEWFGSGGHSGFREILVSNRLAKIILEKGWHGVALKPVEVV